MKLGLAIDGTVNVHCSPLVFWGTSLVVFFLNFAYSLALHELNLNFKHEHYFVKDVRSIAATV